MTHRKGSKRVARPEGRASAINYGIQSTSVTAEVMAVGAGSRAIKSVNARALEQELPALVAELRSAIDRLSLQPPARQVIEEDVAKLNKAAEAKERNPERIGGILESITGKLKMVGTLVSGVAEIAGPLTKIAALFGVPVPW